MGISVLACTGIILFSCKKTERDSVVTPVDKVKSSKDARFDATANIVGIDWSRQSANNFYYWSSAGVARFGTYLDTDPSGTSTYSYTCATGKTPSQIAELIIDNSLNQVYAFYLDGTYSVGTSNDLDHYHSPVPYILPAGKTPYNIVGMVSLPVTTGNQIHVFYNDGTRSYGDPNNLNYVVILGAYSLPPGKSYSDIIGMAVDRDSPITKLYTWYSDSTVSIGDFTDLDLFAAAVPFD